MNIRSITSKAVVSTVLAAVIVACNDSSNSSHSAKEVDNPAKYYVFAVDHEGYVNIFSDDGISGIEVAADAVQLKNSNGEPLTLGEIHFNKGKAIITVQSGMLDGNGVAIGGGLAIIDINTQSIERLLPLAAGNGVISRLVHTYMDPDGQHIWVNNDGPNSSSGLDAATIALDDSVFRVNVDPADTTDTDGDGKADDKYLDVSEIVVGNGHKKSAFSYAEAGHANALPYFATHNMTSKTVSIIDNNPQSPTFLTVVQTVSLGNGAPHGMGYSEHSGHIYTGLVAGDNAVNIIDATLAMPSAGPVDRNIVAGSAVDQIPRGGYVHAHGDMVYTAGYVAPAAGSTEPGKGYLSIIDASNDSVAQVIELGDISSSSFDIAYMNMQMGAMSHEMLKVYVPGRTSGNSLNNQIAVVELDPATGLQKNGTSVSHVTVGAGTDHRNGAVTDDGMHAYYPDGGDCGATHADHGPGCQVINVIDTMTDQVIASVETAGHMPAALGIVAATGAESMSGGHSHEHVH